MANLQSTTLEAKQAPLRIEERLKTSSRLLGPLHDLKE